METFGRIRAGQERLGARASSLDLLVASAALEEGCILVSGDTMHLERLPGLQVEDWTAGAS